MIPAARRSLPAPVWDHPEQMRRLAIPLAIIAVIAIVVIGLTQTGGQKSGPQRLTLAEMQHDLKDAPPDLAAVYSRGNTIVGGSTKAFQAQLATLHGHPVVVNKWASWCGPCRSEFPIFQHVATKLGKQVAFLGINANDHDAAARRFLRSEALPYPSFSDENLAISGKLGIVPIFPTTVFFDAAGKRQYIHQGYYTSTAALTADIRRYAINPNS
jgi:cytochrome c biogenesis protein CcmG, thiol:disulfide interchange protein DsbE